MLTWKNARRLIVFVLGSTVLLLGVILIVTPGPAFLVIPLGLIILATEFVWARRLLLKVRDRAGAFPKVVSMIDRVCGQDHCPAAPAKPNAKGGAPGSDAASSSARPG